MSFPAYSDSPAASSAARGTSVAAAHVRIEMVNSEDDEDDEKADRRYLEHDRVGLLRPRPGE